MYLILKMDALSLKSLNVLLFYELDQEINK